MLFAAEMLVVSESTRVHADPTALATHHYPKRTMRPFSHGECSRPEASQVIGSVAIEPQAVKKNTIYSFPHLLHTYAVEQPTAPLACSRADKTTISHAA